MDKIYTIGEIGEMFGLNSSTLRYYEALGLLTDVMREENNRRVYTSKHIDRLNAIMCFKRTGLPVAGIADFFIYEKNLPEHIDDILQMLTEHEENITEQIHKLDEDLQHIKRKVRYYSAVKESLSTGAEVPDFNSV